MIMEKICPMEMLFVSLKEASIILQFPPTLCFKLNAFLLKQ